MTKTHTFDKTLVINRLTENRAKHRQIFEEALEGYRVKAIEILNSNIKAIAEAKKIIQHIVVPVPSDHTDEYDTMIAMLQDMKEDTVELTQDEYRSYMLDKWVWRHQFLTSNAAYSSTAAGLAGAE